MLLFAQAAPVVPVVPETAAGIIGYIIGALVLVCLSLIGIVIWILKQQYTSTIPGMLAEQKAQRESNEKNLKDQREVDEKKLTAVLSATSADAVAERKLCAEQFGILNASLSALTSAQTAQCQAVVAIINQHTTEQMTAYRHDLTNTIHDAVLGRELAAAKKAAEVKRLGGDA